MASRNIAKIPWSSQMPEYAVWASMKARCSNPKFTGYENYGGRGIKVCQRWSQSFVAFLKDMGLRPSPGHWLDRINNDGNYEMSNCRWTTPKQQQRNRRNNVLIEWNGKTLCVSEWAELSGISASLISARLAKGWSVRDALWQRPYSMKKRGRLPDKSRPNLVTQTVAAKRIGISPQTIKNIRKRLGIEFSQVNGMILFSPADIQLIQKAVWRPGLAYKRTLKVINR